MLIDGPIPFAVIEGDGPVDERYVLSPVPRGFAEGSFSLRRPGVVRGESCVRRELVHDHEALGGHATYSLSPSTSRLLVAFGGTQRLFLKVHPMKVHPSLWRIARLIVETDTLVPAPSSYSSQ